MNIAPTAVLHGKLFPENPFQIVGSNSDSGQNRGLTGPSGDSNNDPGEFMMLRYGVR